MIKAPPDKIENAKVLWFTSIDKRHTPTGGCVHFVYRSGKKVVLPPTSGLIICQYEGMTEYYLFRCDSQWQVQSDTLHESIEKAMEQSEFEYRGSSETWISTSHDNS